MPSTYYYRSGQRIPVIVADSARAARVADERSLVEVEGWKATPITSHHILLVNKELVTDRDTLRTADNFRNLATLIAHRERTHNMLRPRSTLIDLQERPAANLINRNDLATFPVAVKMEGEGLLISTGEVVVQFPESVSHRQVEEFAVSNNWTIARTLPFLTNGYVLRANTTADTFEFANQLVERTGAEFAHPVFLEDIPERRDLYLGDERAAPPSPASAELFARQWHLQNTGQNGSLQDIDINAASAWKISFGSNNIHACVIDSGVNLNHECFQAPGKLLPGYDFADNDAIPAAVESSHGTACSALIGASVGTGQIVGVAPECRIIPIRRPGVSNHLALAESFAWAADHDADVISCSFGIDGQPWVLPDVVRGALEYATTHGRKGKGCPIFWAAGNGNELVSTDEWASSSFTIAVSASTDQGTKAPYSDFGPEVSICAPSSGGVNGIATAVNNGYTTQFGGTSAAAPIAAGVACLILSVAPNMRWSEVRDLMRRTARRIDSAGGQYDSTGHSPYYGFGQVDAMQALLGVDALLEVERATDTFSLARGINDLQTYLARSAAGRLVLSYVTDRRLGILLAIQSDASFLEAVGRVLRLMADLGPNVISGTNITVPEGIWPSVEKIVRTLKLLAPLNLITDRAERSLEPTKETIMANESSSFDDALNRLAGLLGTPTSTPAAGTTGPPEAGVPSGGGVPVTTANPTAQSEEIARQVFYSMGVPLITREQLAEMETGLPGLVDLLTSMKNRPTAKADLEQLMGAIKAANAGTERDPAQVNRAVALGEMMRKDAFGEGERLVPLIGLGIAAFMASYTVVKNWKT